MRVREMADLACLLAFHSPLVISETRRLHDEALGDYWQASRCRLDRWGLALREGSAVEPEQLAAWLERTMPLFEEILVGEVLARSTAAFFVAHDDTHAHADAGPIGRNILTGHVETRHRALQLASAPPVRDTPVANRIVSLSRRCQLWNDVLIGYFLISSQVEEFAFDRDRAIEFSFDAAKHQQSIQRSDTLASTLSNTIQMAFHSLTDVKSPNADLNALICASLLGCFSAEFFDSHGLLRSAWIRRLEQIPDETLAAIEEYWV